MSQPRATIGLEIHVQLQTRTKIFCDSPVKFGAPPNSLTCPVCLGHPGTMPVLNGRAVEQALLLALAMDCRINPVSTFARKSYLYPDLPKGYQITQHNHPLATGGRLPYQTKDSPKTTKWAPLTRIHLEEDAGKLVHLKGGAGGGAGGECPVTLIDFNRAGVPLAEIVTEPCFHDPAHAVAFLRALHTLVRWLGVSDANMEEGSFRCDANVSYGVWGQGGAGEGGENGRGGGGGEGAPNRTEIKNMNTFRGIERALKYEVNRQMALYEAGEEIKPETRLWDEDTCRTMSMRSKESAPDYRYLPEPDLPPLKLGEGLIEEFREKMPELPWERRNRYESQFNLTGYEARQLCKNKSLGEYFEEVVRAQVTPRDGATWIMTELLRQKTNGREGAGGGGGEGGAGDYRVSPAETGSLLRMLAEGKITRTIAKRVFERMWATGAGAEEIIREEGLGDLPNQENLQEVLQEIVRKHPKELGRLREGDGKLVTFFMGQLMRSTRGKADPTIARKLIMELAQGDPKPPADQ